MTGLNSLIDAQDALIAALDTADPRQIDAASKHMATVVDAIKAEGLDVDRQGPGELDTARQRNIEAAKRVNSLTNWTRSKLDRVNELRGATSPKRRNSY